MEDFLWICIYNVIKLLMLGSKFKVWIRQVIAIFSMAEISHAILETRWLFSWWCTHFPIELALSHVNLNLVMIWCGKVKFERAIAFLGDCVSSVLPGSLEKEWCWRPFPFACYLLGFWTCDQDCEWGKFVWQHSCILNIYWNCGSIWQIREKVWSNYKT